MVDTHADDAAWRRLIIEIGRIAELTRPTPSERQWIDRAFGPPGSTRWPTTPAGALSDASWQCGVRSPHTDEMCGDAATHFYMNTGGSPEDLCGAWSESVADHLLGEHRSGSATRVGRAVPAGRGWVSLVTGTRKPAVGEVFALYLRTTNAWQAAAVTEVIDGRPGCWRVRKRFLRPDKIRLAPTTGARSRRLTRGRRIATVGNRVAERRRFPPPRGAGSRGCPCPASRARGVRRRGRTTLFSNSEFELNREQHGGVVSVWSRSSRSHFAGAEGGLSLGGDVRGTSFTYRPAEHRRRRNAPGTPPPTEKLPDNPRSPINSGR